MKAQNEPRRCLNFWGEEREKTDIDIKSKSKGVKHFFPIYWSGHTQSTRSVLDVTDMRILRNQSASGEE